MASSADTQPLIELRGTFVKKLLKLDELDILLG